MSARGRAHVAALSLALLAAVASAAWLRPQPTYDPWAWAVWGRELADRQLDTTGGPSWKPLPPLVIAALSPLRALSETAPATAWVVFERTHALFGLFVVAQLALTFAGRPPAHRQRSEAAGMTSLPPSARAPSARVLSALLAPILLLAAGNWLRYFAAGNEALPAASFAATGALALLVNRRGIALANIFLLTLLRVEALPVFLLCALRLSKVRVGIGLASISVLCWTVPEWHGSGDPLGAFRQAASRPEWAASSSPQPVLDSLAAALDLYGPAALVGCALAAAKLALQLGPRNRHVCRGGRAIGQAERQQLIVVALTLAWTAGVALSTIVGFSGNARYYAPVLPLVAVTGALGWAGAIDVLRSRIAQSLVCTLIVAVAAASVLSDLDSVRARINAERELDAALRAVACLATPRPGGRATAQLEEDNEFGIPSRYLVRAGRLAVARPYQPHAAYLLKLPIVEVERSSDTAEYMLTYLGARDRQQAVARSVTVRSGATARVGTCRLQDPLTRAPSWRLKRLARPAG